MATRATQHLSSPIDAPSGRSTLLIANSRAAADPKKGLLPRTALGDIGNQVAKLQVRADARKSAVEEYYRLRRSVGPAAAVTRGHKAIRNSLRLTQKKNVLLQVPASQTEPSQPEPQPSTSTEVAASEDALCQAFSVVILECEDPDAEDGDDPSMCSSYVKDIYNYLRHLEEKHPVKHNYLAGQEIDGNMRAIMVDWLVKVHMKFNLQEETLFMAVAIIDHFLQNNPVSKKNLQLVGITALFLACKYEEITYPHIEDFSYVTDYSCLNFQIRQMEKKILEGLDFFLGFPLPLHFLRRASKIAEVDSQPYVLAKYLMELCIVDYDIVHFLPSRIAAAAFCLSLKLFDGCKLLPYLERYMSYTESDLLPVMQHIAKNLVFLNKDVVKEKAVMKKYAMSTNNKISTIKQLQSSIIQDLAKPLLATL